MADSDVGRRGGGAGFVSPPRATGSWRGDRGPHCSSIRHAAGTRWRAGQFIAHEPPNISADTIGPLLLWIDQNLHKELSLPLIAQKAAMSTRTLSRRFIERVGATPARWVALARVRRAQQLLRPPSYRWRRSRRTRGLSRHRFCASISPALSGQLLSRSGVISDGSTSLKKMLGRTTLPVRYGRRQPAKDGD
jgi:AraC-like DNA-binding protein